MLARARWRNKMTMIKIHKKAILPKGFVASGVSCGIKRSGKPDLALFFSLTPAVAAGVFTTNTMKAAPVELDLELLKRARTFQGIIVNSGNANCFTGKKGRLAARAMAEAAAQGLGIAPGGMLVASTGIIGRQLPVQKISAATAGLVTALSRKGIHHASRAILTTDTCVKQSTARFSIDGREVTVCAVAKGAGMIAPRMATMLCFILTDAAIGRHALQTALRQAVAGSFNRITIDGCMSTNDSVMVLANAQAGNAPVSSASSRSLFSGALESVCRALARQIVLDAEGSTKLITIRLSGARTDAHAQQAAMAIANSNLFKTAMYGENLNYGRVVAAVGASGVACRQDSFKVSMGSLKRKSILVRVDLGLGTGSAEVLTSDLTPEYVRINAEYS